MPQDPSQNEGWPNFFPCCEEDSAPLPAHPDAPPPFQASTFQVRMLFEPYRFGVWGYCCEGRTRRIALYQSPYVASAAREARDRSATNVKAPLALPSKDAS